VHNFFSTSHHGKSWHTEFLSQPNDNTFLNFTVKKMAWANLL